MLFSFVNFCNFTPKIATNNLTPIPMSEEVYHIPALLPECLEALDIRPDGIYVDAT